MTAGAGGNGNIGSPGSAVVVSRGASGTTSLQLTAVATGTTITANGNIHIIDSDTDVPSSTPAVLLGASAASAETGDSSGGNFSLTTTAGGIGFAGAVTATTGITLVAQTNILQQTGGSLSSPNITLQANAASGTISLSTDLKATPVSGNGGSLTLSAATITNTSTGLITISADGTGTGTGGSIILEANQIDTSTSPSLHLSANAGALSSSAGIIEITSVASITLGTSATGDTSISATGAGVVNNLSQPLNGVSVQTSGNLTVFDAAISVGPGSAANCNGGNVVLAATGSTSKITFDDSTPLFNGQSSSNPGTNGTGTGSGGYVSMNATTSITGPSGADGTVRT